jgi:hypothetical protein
MTEQNKTERKCGRKHLARIEGMFRTGNIIGQAERYVNDCLEGPAEGERAQFPNLAGLGRVMGVGLGELQRLGEKYPAVYDAVLAVLEDGALNAQKIPGKSALLAMNYFRRRLGYEVPRPLPRESGDKEVSIVFEHDIGEDGG